MRMLAVAALLSVAAHTHAAGSKPGDVFALKWPSGTGPVMTASGVPVAQMSVVKVSGHGSAPARLVSRRNTGATVTETWSLDEPAVDIVLQYRSVASIPATKVKLKAVNRQNVKAAVCVAVEWRLLYDVNKAILFDFTKAPYVELAYKEKGMSGASWKAEKDLNAQMGLYGYPNRNTIYNCWGTTDLCNPLDATDYMYSTLYLPIVSLYNSRTGGLVAWCDPRSPMGFDGDHKRLRLQHTFFLSGQKGSTDAGFEPGDGTGPWPYIFFFGYSSKPTWDLLYSRFYMANAPDLRGGTKSRFGPGLIVSFRASEEWIPIVKRLRITNVNGVSVTYSYPDDVTAEEMKWAKARGITYFAQEGTIGMTIDTEKSPIPIWEPQWVMERYESSLMKDKAGKDQWCWQGKYANPSPRFPFGRDRLAAMKEILDMPVSGFYVDLYLSHAGSDWAHPIDAMPFYPMSRAFYEYLSAIAKETRKKGLLFNINAPHPSNLVGKYADSQTFDTDAPIWLMTRAYGDLTGISSQYWTNLQDTVPKLRQSMSDCLLYGILTGPYVISSYLLPSSTVWPDDQKQAMLDLYERHYRLCWQIGRARLVKGTSTDGRPGPFIYYRGADGTCYITVQNLSQQRRTFDVPLELEALGLRGVSGLRCAVWDIDKGLGPAVPIGRAASHKVSVAPGMTSVLVLTHQSHRR